jgi:hypothetical protein
VIEIDRDPGLVVAGDVLINPPQRANDCTCISCCFFRIRHYVARAVFFSSVTVVVFLSVPLFPQLSQRVAVMIIGTVIAVPTALCWYKPLKRLRHVRHPKTTQWPPPIS